MRNQPGGPPPEQPWWQEAVFYQIYPRSFCLADPAGRERRLAQAGDGARRERPDRVVHGAGDLEGIRRHLDHLVWLGVDAIWLSPFYRSPMKDFGYDVSDYCEVDPIFGTMEDFEGLLADAHAAGLRVIVDFVPNHTSDQHRWFVDARSSRTSRHRSWYVWRDPDPTDPDRPPNNWRRSFGEGPAWTFDEATGQWYLHLFLPEQPDLDWSNPEVVAAMTGVMRYWLDKGVDGCRVDVVHALGKDPALPDAPPEVAAIPWSALNDDERTHPILRGLREFTDQWPQHPVLVGEVFLIRTATVAKYYGKGDELHLAFNFPPMFCPYDAGCFRRRVNEVADFLTPIGAWPTWVLSSHDRPRHRTRYGGSERRARAAAVLLAGLRGTPFLYAGEELGLEDAAIPADDQVDPGGRDGCRAPIPWTAGPDHGWALGRSEPWLPFAAGAGARNAATLMEDAGSILHLYRRLLALRRRTEALRTGSSELEPGAGSESGDGTVLAWRRWVEPVDDAAGASHEGPGQGSVGAAESWWVAVNFGDEPAVWAPPGPAVCEITSGGDGSLSESGQRYGGTLGPDEAVVLRAAAER